MVYSLRGILLHCLKCSTSLPTLLNQCDPSSLGIPQIQVPFSLINIPYLVRSSQFFFFTHRRSICDSPQPGSPYVTVSKSLEFCGPQFPQYKMKHLVYLVLKVPRAPRVCDSLSLFLFFFLNPQTYFYSCFRLFQATAYSSVTPH